MLRFRWITFDRFKVVNLSRFYRVNFIRPYWVNFTVFSNIINKHKKFPFVRTYTNGNMSVFKY